MDEKMEQRLRALLVKYRCAHEDWSRARDHGLPKESAEHHAEMVQAELCIGALIEMAEDAARAGCARRINSLARGTEMCKVKNKYVVGADGFAPGYTDIQNARVVAAQIHDRTGDPQVIYLAVEITHARPSPIEFKAVDGVSED